MLIDSNSYIGHWPFRPLKGNTCEEIVERMNRNGVALSIVSNLNGVFYKNTQNANEELYEQIQAKKSHKDRFIPFAVINPVYSGWREDFKTCRTKMGMKGIRLHPQYHRYELTHPHCIELVKMARDHDMPVALSHRLVDNRPSSWLDLPTEWTQRDMAPIVRAVPDAKFLILNLANDTDLEEADLALFRKAQLVMDTSGRNVKYLGKLIQLYGKDKFAFGTHAPILDYLTGLIRVESLREQEATENTKELIRSGNVRKLLNL